MDDAVKRYRARREGRIAARMDADFKEEDHPRAKDGKFTSGSGESSESKPEKNAKETAESPAKAKKSVSQKDMKELNSYIVGKENAGMQFSKRAQNAKEILGKMKAGTCLKCVRTRNGKTGIDTILEKGSDGKWNTQDKYGSRTNSDTDVAVHQVCSQYNDGVTIEEITPDEYKKEKRRFEKDIKEKAKKQAEKDYEMHKKYAKEGNSGDFVEALAYKEKEFKKLAKDLGYKDSDINGLKSTVKRNTEYNNGLYTIWAKNGNKYFFDGDMKFRGVKEY